MDLSVLLISALIIASGAALQSVAGFGFGMFAIPLLMLQGRASFEAVAIILVCGAVQTVVALWAHRREVLWKEAAWMTLVASIFVPVGVWTLGRLSEWEPAHVRQVFGVVILLGVLVQWWLRPALRAQFPLWVGLLALSIGGFLSGLCGMGGPPIVLWVMAHDWSNIRSRSTLWALWTGLTPVQLGFLYLEFGAPTLEAIGTGLALSPLGFAGILPGLLLGTRISIERLRVLSYLILLLIAVYAIVQPYLPTF